MEHTVSQRGRNLFDKYVREMLRHPMLTGLSLQSHVHNLLSEARDAEIGRGEMEEEVGPLMQALSSEKARQEIGDMPPDQKDKDGPPT